MMISSGEVPVDAKLTEDRARKARAGQLVRMLDIPAERAFGVFDHGPDGDAAALAKACKSAAMSAYGTAGPEFVRRLIAEGVTGDDVRSIVNDFVAAEVRPARTVKLTGWRNASGSSWRRRRTCDQIRLDGWRKGEARNAAAWALKQWIEGRGGTEPAEVRQAVEQVRLMIEAHGESRFQSLDDPDAKPVNNRLGWRTRARAEREWWVPPQVWKEEICAGLDAAVRGARARRARDAASARRQPPAMHRQPRR